MEEKKITWVKQPALWLYDNYEYCNYGDVMGLMCRVKAVDQSLQTRLHRSDTYHEKDTDEDSDEELLPVQETYEVHIQSDKDGVSPRRTTRSLTLLRSRKYTEPAMVSDIDDNDDSEVDMGKLKERRRSMSSQTQPGTDQPEPVGCTTLRDDDSR